MSAETSAPIWNSLDCLADHALRQPQQVAFRILPEGQGEGLTITWADLERQSSVWGAWLAGRAQRGDRVVLLVPTSLEFILALIGCWKAGLVPVPLEPPRPRRRPERLQNVVRDCAPALILTTTGLREPIAAGLPDGGPSLLVVEDVTTDQHLVSAPSDLALLQYTSGSTGDPKGVRITHANFLSNARAIADRLGIGPSSVMLTWLPMFHDMGLVAHVITPLVIGCASVLMPSMAFVQQPRCWLAAVDRLRVTHTGGPDFGYHLVAKSVRPSDLAGLDLSCLRCAYSGAEPVRPATLAAFTALCVPAGFNPAAWMPCYGLAEATLIVSGRLDQPRRLRLQAQALEDDGLVIETQADHCRMLELVSCGRPALGVTMRIVDPQTGAVLPERRMGEIRVRSAGVTEGYFLAPDGRRREGVLSEDADGIWLCTGDLGFLDQGELFINGRIKDLIIQGGRKHHPVDLEATAGMHPAVVLGRLAAFAVEQDGRERVVLLVELEPRTARRADEARLAAIRQELRLSVVRAHEVEVQAVLLPPGSIPTTSSGKIRRRASRSAWLEGRMTPIVGQPCSSEVEVVVA